MRSTTAEAELNSSRTFRSATHERSGQGWNYWRSVWAAWCPVCAQETMPFPSGRCAFCDSHLAGQPTRAVREPVLTTENVEAARAAQGLVNRQSTKAA